MGEERKLQPRERTIGRLIQEYRARNGWTQEDLAWEAEVSRAQVGRIERNLCEPTVKTLKKLEKALKMPKGILVEFEESDEKSLENSEINQEKNTFCELEHILLETLTETEMQHVRDAIGVLTEALKK